MTPPKSALVLGGGLAGLTCAHDLAKAGVHVTLLEKLPAVGGLARNVEYGKAKFDLGGHRFFSEKPELIAWLRELVGDRLRQVGRKSRILLNGRYFDYPLRAFNALSGFGAAGSAKIITDYAAASLRRSLAGGRDVSFEDWVSSRFGQRLYDIYFKPYTEKVWGIPCDQISADWAEQRLQLLDLSEAVRKALWTHGRRPKTYAQEFWYPADGIGVIAETLADRLRQMGGEVSTGREVREIAVRKGRIAEASDDKRTYKADVVISTIPLTRLGALVGAPAAALAQLYYRAIRCIYLLLDMDQVTDDSWLYFPEANVVFGRSHEPANWAPNLAPPQGTSLCLEVFCNEGDDNYQRDRKELADRCIADLDRLGLVRASSVTAVHDERVPNAYPVFHVDYLGPLHEVRKYTDGIANLHLLGRTGAYRYDNMDQVAEAAMGLARKLVGG